MTREQAINEVLVVHLFGWEPQRAQTPSGELVWWERRTPCPEGSPFEYTVVDGTSHLPNFLTWSGVDAWAKLRALEGGAMIDIEKRDLPTRAEMRGSCPDMAETMGQTIARLKIERNNLRRYIDLLRGRLSGAQREAREYHAKYNHATQFYITKLAVEAELEVERDDLRRQLEQARLIIARQEREIQQNAKDMAAAADALADYCKQLQQAREANKHLRELADGYKYDADAAQATIQQQADLMGQAATEMDNLRRQLDESQEHERQTHERVGAVLGTHTSLEDAAANLQRQLEQARVERDEWRANYRAELVGAAELKELKERYGGHNNETFPAFVGRLAAERDDLQRKLAEERKLKNELVLKAYPAMDERDDLRQKLESARDLACELGNKAGRWHLQREALKGGVKRVVSKLWDMENERNGAMTAYVLQKEEANEAQATITQQAEEITRLRGALSKAEAFLDEQDARLPMSGREAAALATIRAALGKVWE